MAQGVLRGQALQDLEFPLGGLSAVVSDAFGNVYCALDFYGRIQVYGEDGGFLGGWSVPADGGGMHLAWTKESQLLVCPDRGRTAYLYDPLGQLVRRERILGTPSGFCKQEAGEPQGPALSIRQSIVWPSVVRRSAGGRLHSVVRSTFGRWLWMGPFSALAFFFVGIVLAGFAKWLRGKQTRRVSQQ